MSAAASRRDRCEAAIEKIGGAKGEVVTWLILRSEPSRNDEVAPLRKAVRLKPGRLTLRFGPRGEGGRVR